MYQIKITSEHCFGYFDVDDDFYDDEGIKHVDKPEIERNKNIGIRLTEARGLLKNLSVPRAAEMMGVDPDFLRSVELGIDVSEIPLTLICRASEVYDVSTDFLLGYMGSEWERAPETRLEREANFWFQDAHLSMFSQWSAEQLRQQKRQDALSKTVAALLQSVDEIHEALRRFVELNPEVDNMRAGSALLYWVENAAQKAEQAERDLKRCRVLPVQSEAFADG